MDYRKYTVSRRDKQPLLQFILGALLSSGCRILHHSGAGEAPFRITFEAPDGERIGIIAYAFLANRRVTRNRPEDEHRFQVAEAHLVRQLSELPDVAECARLEEDGRPDVRIALQGQRPLYIECKNILRATYADGTYRLDFQRTRASKADPCSRYYAPEEFDLVAACLHPRTERWEFRYVLTTDLDSHDKCKGRLSNRARLDERWSIAPCRCSHALRRTDSEWL